MLSASSLILLLFLCVLLHEYGHALTARRYGIGTRSITLLPIGGLALLQSMPRDPRQEIVVALAGPAVNLAIAAVALLLIELAGRPGCAPRPRSRGKAGCCATLFAANLMLALFNLIPAFPMDGGRVLRAVLAMRIDRVRATRIAARVGQVLAVGLGLLGLFGNPILLLDRRLRLDRRRRRGRAPSRIDARLGEQPAGRAMITDFHTLAPGDTLARARST